MAYPVSQAVGEIDVSAQIRSSRRGRICASPSSQTLGFPLHLSVPWRRPISQVRFPLWMRSLAHAITRLQADLWVTQLFLFGLHSVSLAGPVFLAGWDAFFQELTPRVMVIVEGISSNVNSHSLLPFTAAALIIWLHLIVHGSFLLGS